MTEAEWLTSRNPKAMLGHLRPNIADRKLRLFACACCRRLSRFVSDQRIPGALDALERYASGEGRERDRIDARNAAEVVYDNINKPQDCICNELQSAAQKTIRRGEWHPGESAAAAVGWSDRPNFVARKSEERAAQAVILREISGNPFRPVAFAPEWRTSTATAIARQMYESRDFGAMPILADALQDAGCDIADILDHCRDPLAAHVRGCWVVDLVLGKA